MQRQETGAIAAAAALAAGGTLLLARQLQSRRQTEAAMLMERASEHARRPGTLATVAALAIGGILLSGKIRKANGSAASTTHDSIEVEVPVSTAYNQWTQFEEFPRFMASVQEVRQVDDTHLHWRAVVAGKVKEWDAEITEQVPDQRIAWRSIGGVRNEGTVTFERIGDNRTRVRVQMDYDPQTAGEKVGAALGGVKLTTRGNLQRFKELIERRGVETGAWRGTVTEH